MPKNKVSKHSRVQRGRTRPAGAIREFLLSHIGAHPNDIVAITANRFNISPVAVQKHLRGLVDEGRVIKRGRTRNTAWLLSPRLSWNRTLKAKGLSEHTVWDDVIEKELGDDLPENTREIIRYGFTEMLNNVIDHSGAKNVRIEILSHSGDLAITISDNGIGVFKKIQEAFHLADPRESILELTKGKVTTDPSRHSGEGLFFTSRAFDRFELASGGLVFVKDNLQDDWLIDSRDNDSLSGTAVTLRIRKNAKTILRDIFNRYANPETHRFDRTHMVVELAKNEETDYVSRSQAKRILAGLEKFRHVVLDFRNVRTVGQAFVDEVFRVFANAHPSVEFEVTNANSNVQFMISRGIATSTPN